MKFTYVELTNWRGFDHIRIELDRPFTLLAGVNGAGKTSILTALVVALSTAPGLGPAYGHGRTRPIHLPAEPWLRHDPTTIRFGVADQGDTTDLEFGAPVRWPFAPTRPPASLVLSIDDRRSSPSEDYDPESRRPTGTALAYEDWRQPGIPWWAIREWMVEQTQIGFERYYIATKKGRSDATLESLVPELTAVSRAVSECLGEDIAIRYHVEPDQLLIHMPDGKLLDPDQLSAGYRQVLAMVADLARRCVVLNPKLGVDAPHETPGIVLIDELELHLHPKWQRLIVKGLQRAFPKLQFICTTHSPQILSEAPPGSVVLLSPGDKVAYPTATHGRDANAILEEILGVPSRPEALDAKFEAFHQAVDGHDVAAARKLLDELEGVLGSDVAEIISARWTLQAEQALEGEPGAT